MPDGRPGGVIRTSQFDGPRFGSALGRGRRRAGPPSPERGPRRRPPPTPVALEREDERNTLVFIGLQLYSKRSLARVLNSAKSPYFQHESSICASDRGIPLGSFNHESDPL